MAPIADGTSPSAGGSSLAPLLGLVLAADAAVAQEPDVLPLGEVESGQRAVARTVFKGTTIEEFDVEIVSVVHDVGPDQDLILARARGDRIEHVGVAQGMSGEPRLRRRQADRRRLLHVVLHEGAAVRNHARRADGARGEEQLRGPGFFGPSTVGRTVAALSFIGARVPGGRAARAPAIAPASRRSERRFSSPVSTLEPSTSRRSGSSRGDSRSPRAEAPATRKRAERWSPAR